MPFPKYHFEIDFRPTSFSSSSRQANSTSPHKLLYLSGEQLQPFGISTQLSRHQSRLSGSRVSGSGVSGSGISGSGVSGSGVSGSGVAGSGVSGSRVPASHSEQKTTSYEVLPSGLQYLKQQLLFGRQMEHGRGRIGLGQVQLN